MNAALVNRRHDAAFVRVLVRMHEIADRMWRYEDTEKAAAAMYRIIGRLEYAYFGDGFAGPLEP